MSKGQAIHAPLPNQTRSLSVVAGKVTVTAAGTGSIGALMSVLVVVVMACHDTWEEQGGLNLWPASPYASGQWRRWSVEAEVPVLATLPLFMDHLGNFKT